MSLSLAPDQVKLAHKGLIDDQLWQRLTTRITADLEFQQAFGDELEDTQRRVAERILNETLSFLTLCAQTASHSHSPSRLVDIGWHTFILYTHDYTDFCQRTAGHYIHHSPSDVPGHDYGTGNANHTLTALRARGPVDEMLWASATAGCNGSCSNGQCCSDCKKQK